MKRSKSPQGSHFLAYSIGIVYLWFGALKFFPGLSPAEGLASETIGSLTAGLLPSSLAMVLLAVWECTVGVLLLSGHFRKMAIGLGLVHIVLTFSPMLLFPEKVFSSGLLALTLTGQYITKNIIIISALFYLRQQCQQEDTIQGKRTTAHWFKGWKKRGANRKSTLARWILMLNR